MLTTGSPEAPKDAWPPGPDLSQVHDEAQALRRALLEEQQALSRQSRQRFAQVLAAVGALGLLLPPAVLWLGWDGADLPHPAFTAAIGIVLLGFGWALGRSPDDKPTTRLLLALGITAASGASWLLNGIHGALTVPLTVLVIHGLLPLHRAGLLGGGLVGALIGWHHLLNTDASLPLWRIVGVAAATLAWAQWQGRQQARLDRAQQGAIERLDTLTQALSGQLSQAEQARQRAERALWAEREAQSRAQAMKSLLLDATEGMRHGLAVIDDRQRLVGYNQRFATLLDLPASLLGTAPKVAELVAFMERRGDFGDDFSAVEPEVARLLKLELQGAGETGSSTYVRRTLQDRHLEIATYPSEQGLRVRTVSDITDHIRLTEALQQALLNSRQQLVRAEQLHEQAQTAVRERDRNLQWLTAAMQAVSYGLMIKNDRGSVQFTNPQLSDLLRLPPDYFAQPRGGMDVLKFQLERGDFREDSAIIFRAVERAQTLEASTPVGERPRWVQELPSDPDSLVYLQILRGGNRLLWETGDGRFIQSDFSLLPSGGYVQVYSDVTELARTQRELQASLAELRQVERGLKSELATSREKMDLQAQFVAAVSHELRTPLNGIVGMAALLGETSLDATQITHLQDLQSSVQQLRRLTDELLDLARAGAPGFRLESTPFDLHQPLRACVGAAQVAARGRPVTVRMDLASPTRQVLGDPLRLAQIVNNLLANALKFTVEGTVSLRASWTPLEHDAGRIALRLDVTDTGRGIDPALQEAIFEPFHQGQASTNRTHGGTGLGLALCRQLVRAMQGTIEVRSDVNQGATFTVIVELALHPDGPDLDRALAPAADASGPIETRNGPQTLPRLDGCRLLVADDNRVNQKLMTIWLTAAGAQVVSVHDGAAAVQAVGLAAGSAPFDAIVMDVAMPVMTGLEATRILRGLEQQARMAGSPRPAMPIVGVTAMARAQDRQTCLDAGMSGHLVKPVDRALLLQTLRQALDEARWSRGFDEVFDHPVSAPSAGPTALSP